MKKFLFLLGLAMLVLVPVTQASSSMCIAMDGGIPLDDSHLLIATFEEYGKTYRILDLVSGNTTLVENLGTNSPSWPALSPDKTKIAYSPIDDPSSSVWIYDLASSQVINRLNLPQASRSEIRFIRYFVWLTDSSGLIISDVSYRHQHTNFYLYRPGQSFRLLLDLPSDAIVGKFSPDGSQFAISVQSAEGSQIVLYNIETGQMREVAQTDGLIDYFSWSADGSQLMLNGHRVEQNGDVKSYLGFVRLLDLRTSSVINIDNVIQDSSWVEFSPFEPGVYAAIWLITEKPERELKLMIGQETQLISAIPMMPNESLMWLWIGPNQIQIVGRHAVYLLRSDSANPEAEILVNGICE